MSGQTSCQVPRFCLEETSQYIGEIRASLRSLQVTPDSQPTERIELLESRRFHASADPAEL